MRTIDHNEFNEILSSFRHGPRSTFGINSVSPYVIAEALGISYQGDMSLEHGGTFYDPSDWTEYGCADACSVIIADGCLFVTAGQIVKSEVSAAMECCGIDVADMDEASRIHAEITACESYSGICCDRQDSHVYAIIERFTGNRGDGFRVNGREIDLDNMQGWIVRTKLTGSVISLD